jgi:hypothetical protein
VGEPLNVGVVLALEVLGLAVSPHDIFLNHLALRPRRLRRLVVSVEQPFMIDTNGST